jgi:hypothetical protein
VARVLAVVFGLGLLVLLIGVTLGFALVAPIGMAAAAGVQRWRHRSYTRMAGWIGAVVASAIATAVALVFVMRQVPAGSFDAAVRQAMIDQKRHPPQIPRALQRLAPNAAAAPAIEAQTDALTRSPVFVWVTMTIGVAIGCFLFGLLIGTPMWACATLALFGATGRRASRPRESTAMPSFAPAPKN